jgi:hypothetical protein
MLPMDFSFHSLHLYSKNKESPFNKSTCSWILSSLLLLALLFTSYSISNSYEHSGNRGYLFAGTASAIADSKSSATNLGSSTPSQIQAGPRSILLTNIERIQSVERAGDAMHGNNYLKTFSTVVDEECCNSIQYTPGPQGVAGISYEANQTLDLAGAKRVVFFVKGERGGERISFMAAGSSNFPQTPEPSGALSTIPPLSASQARTDIFEDKNFSKVTEDLVLSNDWTRYQINLNGTDLTRITNPFGFVVSKDNNVGRAVTFSLKGVTYDTKSATDPVDTVEQNITSPASAVSSSNPSNVTDPSATNPPATNSNKTTELVSTSPQSNGNNSTRLALN